MWVEWVVQLSGRRTRQAIPIHVRRIRKCWKSKPKRKKEMKIESLRGIIVGVGMRMRMGMGIYVLERR